MVGVRQDSAAPESPPSQVTFDSRVACETPESYVGRDAIAQGGGFGGVQADAAFAGVRARQEF